MIGRFLPAIALALSLAMPTLAMAEGAGNLSDMRAELTALRAELSDLRSELVASGPEGFQAAGGDTAIDRMDAIEAQLTRLTDRTEQLQNRINRIVEEGTRRISDLEFRLCEMDQTCDLGALTMPELGGYGAAGPIELAPAPSVEPEATDTAATASEQADFDRANAALGQGDFERAAELFAAVAQKYAGGPLTAEALYLRGAALDSATQPKAAAAAWLEGFAADPDGPRAAESLLGIARVIADDGDAMAACLYLAEIPARFPATASATEADRRMAALECGTGNLAGLD